MHQRSLFYKQNSDIKSETFVCVKEYNNNYSIFQTHSFLGKEKQMKLKNFVRAHLFYLSYFGTKMDIELVKKSEFKR